MNQHKNDSINKTCLNKYKTPLALAIQRYGWENFELTILEQHSDPNIINQLEIKYIKEFNTYGDDGYNASIGGEFGYSGRKYHSKVEKNFNDIVQDLKDNNKSIKQLSQKYNISESYLSDINTGARLHKDYLSYPLRPQPQSHLISYYPKIIYDLCFTDISMRQLAKKYHTSLSTIQSINKGNKTARMFYDNFPIR